MLVVVWSCGGGGGGGGGEEPVKVSTLAYVTTECRLDSEGLTIRQSLQIRQGEQPAITAVEHSSAIDAGAAISCSNVGLARQGPLFADLGVFRRLGVTPDGSQIVFEVTDEIDGEFLPLAFPTKTLPAEQKGIFVVAADGTGLRRMGPASSVASFFVSFFAFSPNGRMIAYTDHGLDSENRNAVQIVTLDLVTGDRRQVTELPPATGIFGGTYLPFFNDDQTITFFTRANADGEHPFSQNIVVTIHTDGTGLTVASPNVALPGSEVLASFRITGSELDAAVLVVPGTPENPGVGSAIQEVFDIDRENNVLQLTNFRRSDTFSPTVIPDGQRVLFTASADPLGTNPGHGCQVFSIDRLGTDTDLRQLSNFDERPEGRDAAGCEFAPPPLGCIAAFVGRDIRTDAVLFYSSCDPLGTNPHGSQVFAMRSDGTGLRQLTETQGYTRDESSVTVELPFPFAWPGFQLRNQ